MSTAALAFNRLSVSSVSRPSSRSSISTGWLQNHHINTALYRAVYINDQLHLVHTQPYISVFSGIEMQHEIVLHNSTAMTSYIWSVQYQWPNKTRTVDLLAEFTAETTLILRPSFDGVEAWQMDDTWPDDRRRRSAHDADSHDLLQVIGSSEQRLTSHQLTQNTPVNKHHCISQPTTVLISMFTRCGQSCQTGLEENSQEFSYVGFDVPPILDTIFPAWISKPTNWT